MSQDEQLREPLQNMPFFRRLQDMDPEQFVLTRMYLPTSVVDRINHLKTRYQIRNRDALVAAFIRQARIQYRLDDFPLPPEPLPGDEMQSLKLSLQAEHMEFLYRLQRRFRGAALGVTLEAIFAKVRDLRPQPVQLSLQLSA